MERTPKIITLRVSQSLADQMEADAKAQGLSRSAFIRQLYLVWRQFKADTGVERREDHDK